MFFQLGLKQNGLFQTWLSTKGYLSCTTQLHGMDRTLDCHSLTFCSMELGFFWNRPHDETCYSSNGPLASSSTKGLSFDILLISSYLNPDYHLDRTCSWILCWNRRKCCLSQRDSSCFWSRRRKAQTTSSSTSTRWQRQTNRCPSFSFRPLWTTKRFLNIFFDRYSLKLVEVVSDSVKRFHINDLGDNELLDFWVNFVGTSPDPAADISESAFKWFNK